MEKSYLYIKGALSIIFNEIMSVNILIHNKPFAVVYLIKIGTNRYLIKYLFLFSDNGATLILTIVNRIFIESKEMLRNLNQHVYLRHLKDKNRFTNNYQNNKTDQDTLYRILLLTIKSTLLRR